MTFSAYAKLLIQEICSCHSPFCKSLKHQNHCCEQVSLIIGGLTLLWDFPRNIANIPGCNLISVNSQKEQFGEDQWLTETDMWMHPTTSKCIEDLKKSNKCSFSLGFHSHHGDIIAQNSSIWEYNDWESHNLSRDFFGM